jgi:hypothetical protein
MAYIGHAEAPDLANSLGKFAIARTNSVAALTAATAAVEAGECACRDPEATAGPEVRTGSAADCQWM